MPDIAFVVFNRDIRKGKLKFISKIGFLRFYIGTALFHRLSKKKLKRGIQIIEIEPGLKLLLIKYPFPLSLLSVLNKPYVEHYISQLYAGYGCLKCFVPVEARKLSGFEAYAPDNYSRAIIFRALLVPILNEIYSGKGYRLDNLDTAFVYGGNVTELITMVSELEPFVRYINVAAADKETVESGLSDICSESGISIFVSSDFKSILRNADLVINLGKGADISKYRIKSKALVINFSFEDEQRLQGEFNLITGVEFTFPPNQYDVLGEDIQRSFSITELTEILMAAKAGFLEGARYNNSTVDRVLKTYKNSCCSITGFHGRRGILRVEDFNV